MKQPVDMRFFQAAATVIPTLIIAVVVGLRLSERIDIRALPDKRRRKADQVINIIMWLLVMVAFSAVELKVLNVLMDGHGDKQDAVAVLGGIILLLAYLTLETLRPALEKINTPLRVTEVLVVLPLPIALIAIQIMEQVMY